jgi:hypothetical protein
VLSIGEGMPQELFSVEGEILPTEDVEGFQDLALMPNHGLG